MTINNTTLKTLFGKEVSFSEKPVKIYTHRFALSHAKSRNNLDAIVPYRTVDAQEWRDILQEVFEFKPVTRPVDGIYRKTKAY